MGTRCRRPAPFPRTPGRSASRRRAGVTRKSTPASTLTLRVSEILQHVAAFRCAPPDSRPRRCKGAGCVFAATSRASSTRSEAWCSPPSVATNSRCPLGGVAAERQDVLDPGVHQLVEGVDQLGPGCADAGDVRHRFDLELRACSTSPFPACGRRVEPPAPQVTLTNPGPSGRSRRTASTNAARPSSVLGGKNSKREDRLSALRGELEQVGDAHLRAFLPGSQIALLGGREAGSMRTPIACSLSRADLAIDLRRD